MPATTPFSRFTETCRALESTTKRTEKVTHLIEFLKSLSANEVYALSAYQLFLNGLVKEDAVMDAKSLAAVPMPNRDGFIPDDRPDTKATRCMKDCM